MGPATPIPLIKPDQAVAEIRRIVREQTDRLYFSDHAELRMIERGISRTQVRRVIATGDLVGKPQWQTDDRTGESGWKCRFDGVSAGARITAISKLIVKRHEPGKPPVLVITVYGE